MINDGDNNNNDSGSDNEKYGDVENKTSSVNLQSLINN
jgi:hypothetical protein